MKLCNRQHDRFCRRGHVIKVDLLPVKWQSARHLDMARLVPREETRIFICFWNFKKVVWKLLLYVTLSPERRGRRPQCHSSNHTVPTSTNSSPCFVFIDWTCFLKPLVILVFMSSCGCLYRTQQSLSAVNLIELVTCRFSSWWYSKEIISLFEQSGCKLSSSLLLKRQQCVA